MIYCKKCGEELKAGQSFCTSCGHTVQPSIEEEKISPVHKEPVSRRKKGWIAVALLLIVVTVAGWKIAENMNKPLKVVKEFEKAVDSNNAKQMAKLLNSGQDEMEVDEEAAAQLIKFYQEDPSALAETKENLRMEAKKIENDELFSEREAGLLSVVEAGKVWGMVPKYGLDFQPVYFKVSANRPDVKLKIDGRDEGNLQEDEAKTFGPYLPIPHKLKASSKGEYATVEDKREVDPQEESTHKIELEFDLRGSTVQLSSNYDEAIVFINGKSTDKTVTELDEIGPVPVDGSLKVHAEVKEKGQLLKSEPVAITEDEVNYGVDLLLDDSAIREAEERAEAALAEKEENRVQDEISIENVIYDHYGNITVGSLSGAYDSFSSSRKSKVGYDKWSEGFGNNIESAVSYVTVEEINGNKAVASFEMISRDDQGNGKELVQTWNGKWNLVKEGYYWKLDMPKITKTKAVTQ